MNEDLESRNCQEILRRNGLCPVKKLGKGGFGTVFLVSKVHGKGPEAELFSVKCTNKRSFTRKPLLYKYLKQEINVQSSIQHPNIVKLLRTFDEEAWNFMVMEYCDLGNLYGAQAQRKGKVFQFEQARKYMLDVVSGLEHLHRNNILHRDLKPENILLVRDPASQETVAKICDFGFAKQTEQEVSTYCGTTYFMAPEIFAKKKYDHHIDIWAAGVVLFYMVFGAYPFKSINMASQIEIKCKDGFKLARVKGIENASLTQEQWKLLDKIFHSIFRLEPNQRLGLAELREILCSVEAKDHQKQEGQLLSTLETDSQEEKEAIEYISQQIVFIQKVYQQVKTLGFLSPVEQLALKYYLDKYCLTLLLGQRRLCDSNLTTCRLKKELLANQDKQSALLEANLHKIDMPGFKDLFSNVRTENFSQYKEVYRVVLSHVFSKASKAIQDPLLRSQLKLKIFCCHSINRVFDPQFVAGVFVHYFAYRKRCNRAPEFKVSEIAGWIDREGQENLNDTVRLLCEKFYKKNK